MDIESFTILLTPAEEAGISFQFPIPFQELYCEELNEAITVYQVILR